jgi:hypothetical protein
MRDPFAVDLSSGLGHWTSTAAMENAGRVNTSPWNCRGLASGDSHFDRQPTQIEPDLDGLAPRVDREDGERRAVLGGRKSRTKIDPAVDTHHRRVVRWPIVR